MTDDEKATVVDAEKSDGTTVSDEVSDEVEVDESAADEADGDDAETAATLRPAARRRTDWAKVVAYGLLPALALVLALAAGYLKYVDNSVRDAAVARVESMQAAKDSTVAILSYQPDTVDAQLTAHAICSPVISRVPTRRSSTTW